MIIGNNFQGTQRDNINRLKGEKEENTGLLGERYRNDDLVNNLLNNNNNDNDNNDLMEAIDPDDRGADYEDEKDWKDFY